MPTIIIPMHTTRTRDCVVVEGKRYCESQDIDKGDVAWVAGLFLLWLVLVGVGVWWDDKRYDTNMALWATMSPFILGPIAALIWAFS